MEQQTINEMLRWVNEEPPTKMNANEVLRLYNSIADNKWNHCLCNKGKIVTFYNHIKSTYDN